MKAPSNASNFIRHWINVRADGFKPERLLSLITAEGIPVRQVKYKDETEIYFSLPEGSYKKVKKLVKSKYKLTIVQEGGIKPAVRRLRMNKLMIAGVMVFILFYLLQSCFVREILVIGCETIPEDDLRVTLKEEGLYEGSVKNFDCNQIEKRLFQEYENIVWAKVSFQGNYVQVEVSEGELLAENLVNRDVPCDIVAETDCYIEKIYPYKGRSMVETGDFVKKGGILISGTVPIEHPTYPLEEDDEKVHYVHAEGKIVARVPYYFSFYIKKDSTEADMEAEVRAWIQKNVPESAEILNKDFHFEQKKNIIKLYGIIETRQPVGIEKEILIDKRQDFRNEENTD